jgi:hypothetical protein
MGFNFGFGAFNRIFVIMFVVIIVVFIAAFVLGLSRYGKNNASPRIPARAKIVAKREDTSTHTQYHAGDVTGAHGSFQSQSTNYFATFEFETGDRMELGVTDREYGLFAEGDAGTLTFQGKRFIGFERNT